MSEPRRQHNRTNVRVLTRVLVAALDRLTPRLASDLAIRAFFRTPKTSPSERTRQFLATGEFRLLEVEELGSVGGFRGTGRLATWRWGEGPAVLLVHGWGGVGGQLSAFVEPLVAAGFSVVAFDAPGHGASGGRTSSLIHFSLAVRALAARLGAFHAVVAHSLGGAAVAHALRHGFSAERLVFVGVPAEVVRYPEGFLKAAGFREASRLRILRAVEERLGFVWDELAVHVVPGASTPPLLVLHDFGDLEVPFSDGPAIVAAWPDARLIATTGLGHRKVLRDETVVQHATEFLTAPLSLGARALHRR